MKIMVEVCGSIECLCNSTQRLRILNALNEAEMDLRGLMSALDCPRSTVQRNLSILEDQNWVVKTDSGYTTTTVGGLLCEEFVAMNETADKIRRMKPFFEAIGTSAEIDINQLNDLRVTTPEEDHPNSPTKRLSALFSEVDCVRGFLPAISYLLIELSRRVDNDNVPECEYVVSSGALDALCQQYADEGADATDIGLPDYLDIWIYEGELPYGLFVSEDSLALAAYNEISRMQALIESSSEESIEWGERVYEQYRQQAKRPHESDLLP